MSQESDLYSIFQDINDLVRLRYISATGTICIYIIAVPYIKFICHKLPAGCYSSLWKLARKTWGEIIFLNLSNSN
jgi:hypothetical protein